jgi:hypothetical protein
MKEIVAALSIVGIACLAGSAALSAQPEWSIAESKASADGSPQVSAALVVGDAALVLRCREQKIEAAYSTQDTDPGDDSVTVRFRIDANEPLRRYGNLRSMAMRHSRQTRRFHPCSPGPRSGLHQGAPTWRRNQRHELHPLAIIRGEGKDRSRMQLARHGG